MKCALQIGLIATLLTNCCAPKIESFGLVINEAKNEYIVNERRITEDEAWRLFDKMDANKTVVMVEGRQVLVATKGEITGFYEELFRAFSNRTKAEQGGARQPATPSESKTE